MLRLWLERYRLHIFPDQSWLTVGTRTHAIAAGDDGREFSDLIKAASDLLEKDVAKRVWRSPIDLIFSDEVARVVVLPWQDSLRTSVQQTRYGEACLADAGVVAGKDWLVQSCFRHFGATGLAFAVPRDFVEQAADLAKGKSLRLRSMLPLSVAVFWRYRGGGRGREALLLLHEKNRITALRFHGRTFQAIDIEPVAAGETEISLRRLLTRQVALSMPDEVGHWSAIETGLEQDLLAKLLPSSVTHAKKLPRASWD